MPHYAYRAKDDYGKTVTGLIEAPTEDEVDSSLRDKGLYVISVEPRAQARPGASRPAARSVGRVSRRDLILLTSHLQTLFSAGIPLAPGLREFADEAPNKAIGAVAAAILERVEGGAMLSDAMAQFPSVFPELYVALVKAGEASGHLDAVFADLVTHIEWQQGIISQVRQASIYPMVLLSALTGLVILLFTFVLPRFAKILERTGAPLPLPTKIVLVVGGFMQANWTYLFFGVVALVVLYRLWGRTTGGRLAIDRFKLQLPIFGTILRKVALSRFTHNLETLHRAGVEFVYALTVLERVVGNAAIARAVAQVKERVIGGMAFTEALRASGEFPPLVLRMVASGEMSGNLADSLGKVSQYYDKEVPDAVRRLFGLIEPVMITVLAVVVLGSILAVFLPIYTILGKIGGQRFR
ncbi:MAG: type II secretion system F family protein [Candidatus Rokubacteria bacterium]|nr:type II secretion system F family protein [Candidatus Rokubacteria bacterium]